ncbi:MAG TPA: ribonuclease P protein component 3 [Methanomicrobia archaeon]|nr:ribonuclease P protein component 3 [Methanomicrobia archaeon]
MPAYIDLNVHAYPETDTPAEELLRVAKRYGFAQIAISNYDNHVLQDCWLADLILGVEIQAQTVTELKRKLRQLEDRVTVIAVHGSDDKITRAAVESPKVDVLTHPCSEKGEGTLSYVLVRFAAENGVAIDFNMSALIRSRRGERARILTTMREQLKLVRKYRAPVILTSHAHSIYDLRAPRELIALAALFGMTRAEAVRALSETPQGVVAKRWKRDRELEVL